VSEFVGVKFSSIEVGRSSLKKCSMLSKFLVSNENVFDSGIENKNDALKNARDKSAVKKAKINNFFIILFCETKRCFIHIIFIYNANQEIIDYVKNVVKNKCF
jgi:hypothetical protein